MLNNNFCYKKFGQLIRDRRKMLGITQAKIAQELGITFQQVQKYEKGISKITADKLYLISLILNIPVYDFFPIKSVNYDLQTGSSAMQMQDYSIGNEYTNKIDSTPKTDQFTEFEKNLIKFYRKCNSDLKAAINLLIVALERKPPQKNLY